MFFYALISTRFPQQRGAGTLEKAVCGSVSQLWCPGHGVHSVPALTLGAQSWFPPTKLLWLCRTVHAARTGSGGRRERHLTSKARSWWEEMGTPATPGEGDALVELLNGEARARSMRGEIKCSRGYT